MSARPPLPEGPYLVLGLGRSGIAAALTLRERGGKVIGADRGRPGGLEQLEAAGVELHLGVDGSELLEGVKTLVKSPGVPGGAPAVALARERGVEVMGELELAWRLLENEFIAVTGTNGKTTTVELIGHIHEQAGLPYVVAGNVGRAASALPGALAHEATVVCEVSSFQLEDASEFAPEAAVLLNVTQDHLDRHATMSSYLQAKLSIFARQGERAIAVLPAELAGDGAALADGTPVPAISGKARRITFSAADAKADLTVFAGRLCSQGTPLLAVSEIALRGRHNLENALAAAVTCLARGVDPEAVRAGLRSFRGVPHRLEEVASHGGVLFVNDSKATNVTSTQVALSAFATPQTEGRVHLILGGQGKGQDFQSLGRAVDGVCARVYLIGEDAELIAQALDGAGTAIDRSGDLETAMAKAREVAEPGDVILLSPACASFDQFTNFESRGERFRELAESA